MTDSKAELFGYAALAAFKLISGRDEPVPRSLLRQCEGTGLQGGWDPSTERHVAASRRTGHTSHLGISKVVVSVVSFWWF
jgi:hypothetical protein